MASHLYEFSHVYVNYICSKTFPTMYALVRHLTHVNSQVVLKRCIWEKHFSQ
uniref:Uncharacterized protein n=1 Tax=Anguilla anguilla TaxID=7936 RepID=A0A0E9R5T9_ANGAN